MDAPKYNIGDQVYIVGTINRINITASGITYEIETNGVSTTYEESDIVSRIVPEE